MYCTVSLFPELLAVPLLLQLLLAFSSFLGGIKFYRYIKRRKDFIGSSFEGPVSVFVPCKGAEEGLRENLEKVLNCGRDETEFLFVVESGSDEAVPVIEKLIEKDKSAQLIFAGNATDSGQKVHNLIQAVKAVGEESEAFVFVDSDARPAPGWINTLLQPLVDEGIGCSTGYRWFLQEAGGLATLLRSAWNASITSSLGDETSSNFCWGGAMAVRRKVFEELKVAEKWKGTLSDDFTLTNVLGATDYRVHFEPKNLTASVGNCDFAELLEFTTRQMKITRIYSPKHFAVSMIGSSIFAISVACMVAGLYFSTGIVFWSCLTLCLSIWMLGSMKAALRVYAVSNVLRDNTHAIGGQYFWHVLLWPISTLLFLLVDFLALLSRRIVWRGIAYELVSDKRIRILDE